ncbi:MAG: ribonuclease III [Lachnospiraceae bacterium]|nr:ribonuclease III [Lachnospiraceae bacterium]
MRENHSFDELEEIIDYHFKDKSLLKLALTHSSYANEHRMKRTQNNERVEFLGDAVLELIISDYLFRTYQKKNEGKLTKLRSSLVCEYTLAMCAKDISLGKYLLLSKGEDMTGGRERDSILSDAFESLIGAIYLDQGFEKARIFVEKYLLQDVENKTLFYDAKTILQEMVQKEVGHTVQYELIEEKGPDHCKEFKVAVRFGECTLGTGSGKTKKAAEQMAAYESILKLKEEQGETCI